MKDKKEFYTVSEFAEIVGISRQAVYKSLNNGLKEFVNEVDGKKMLNKRALSRYNSKKNHKKVEQHSTQHSTSTQILIETLSQTIQTLTAQLDAREVYIVDILDQLKQAQEQNSKLAELLKSEQDLNKANQILIAQAHENQKLLNQDEPKHKKKGFFSIFSKRENKE